MANTNSRESFDSPRYQTHTPHFCRSGYPLECAELESSNHNIGHVRLNRTGTLFSSLLDHLRQEFE